MSSSTMRTYYRQGTLPPVLVVACALLGVARSDLSAQSTAILQGRVTDIDTGLRIEGAIIELDLDPPGRRNS